MFLLDLIGCCFYHFYCFKKYHSYSESDSDSEYESVPLLSDKKHKTLSTKEIFELLNDQEYEEDNYQKMTDNFFSVLPNGNVIYSEKKKKKLLNTTRCNFDPIMYRPLFLCFINLFLYRFINIFQFYYYNHFEICRMVCTRCM